jgi:fructoselysine-6-P-deglycase FrlB-like protein
MPIDDHIREQPAVLRRVFADVPDTLTALLPALPARISSLTLVGSGTSRHALMAAERLLGRRFGCPVSVSGPLAFLAGAAARPGGTSVALLLSQSGASTTTIDAVAAARARGMTAVVLTAERGSPIASVDGLRVFLPIGPEPVGPKTKGYTASIAALLCLATVTAEVPAMRRAAERAIATLESALPGWQARATQLAHRYRDARLVMLLAEGDHLATAHEAALKITEMSGIAAAAFDIEEGLHGRFHALGADSPAFFIARAGDEAARARSAVRTLEALGVPAHVMTIGGAAPGQGSPQDDLPIEIPADTWPGLDLLPAIVPFQWLARELAIACGRTPEAMRYPGLSERLGIKRSHPRGSGPRRR